MTHSFVDRRVWDRSKPPERFATRAEREPDRSVPVQAAGIWQPMETAPKDGSEILICQPGGHSDHFRVLYWDEDEHAWVSRYYSDPEGYTEADLAAAHIKASWAPLFFPSNSLCFGIGDNKA